VQRVSPGPDAIAATLASHRYGHASEAELQVLLGGLLREAFPDADVRAEVPLSTGDRIDFMVGRVGVEVKVKGSAPAVLRQLHRYAQHDDIDSLVLVTSRASHLDMPPQLRGKPLVVCSLLGALL
jgi:hypothetical protein